MGKFIKHQSLKITHEILALIAEVDEFKGSWSLVGQIMPERLLRLKHVATIESIGSSTRIEGVKLSDIQIESLLSNIEIKKFTTRDEQEVAGYAHVIETICNHASEIPLTENHIMQLHCDLLQYSAKDTKHRGSYKKLSNQVEAFDSLGRSVGVIFRPSTPFDTPHHMQELVAWTKSYITSKKVHPLITIAVFIVVFLQIHPFQDGNGRLSRALTLLLLIQTGYIYAPYYSLEKIIEQNKEGYYLALRNTQKTLANLKPDWQPWVIYFLRSLKKQKELLNKKMEAEQLLANHLPELSITILDLAKSHGRMTVIELEILTKKNRNTIKLHLKKLVQNKLLKLNGKNRGAWYSVIG